jgi:hypothetical protein
MASLTTSSCGRGVPADRFCGSGGRTNTTFCSLFSRWLSAIHYLPGPSSADGLSSKAMVLPLTQYGRPPERRYP